MSRIYHPIEKSLMFFILLNNALSKSNCVVSLSKFGISINFVRVQYQNIWISNWIIWIFERLNHLNIWIFYFLYSNIQVRKTWKIVSRYRSVAVCNKTKCWHGASEFVLVPMIIVYPRIFFHVNIINILTGCHVYQA